MGIDSTDNPGVLFEVDGYPVLAFEIEEEEDAVYLTCLVESEEPELKENFEDSELFKLSGCDEVLRKRGWVDENDKTLIPLNIERWWKPHEEEPDQYLLIHRLTEVRAN